MNIDWRKAPEGATHYTSTGVIRYYKIVRAGWMYWDERVKKGWIECRRPAPGYREIPAKYFKPLAGNGEDLPAVGTVCEFQESETSWVPVKIIAHVTNDPRLNPIAIYIPEDDPSAIVGQGVARCFRPIRTAEQIAAEERKNSIYEMAGHSHVGRSGFAMDMCAALYDAGYRKCP